jgi:type IV pili sensor histidine kinase/response regulator
MSKFKRSQGAYQTFLEEEAPYYLKILQMGIAQAERDYPALMRAAHSLKGGAGTFQLPQIQHLAHYLEDILEILTSVPLPQGEALLPKAISELTWLIDNASDPQVTVSSELIVALEHAISQAPKPSPEAELQAALEGTLEDCLQIAEARLTQKDLSALSELAESCVLLADELGLPWLQAAVEPLLAPSNWSFDLGQSVITRIRSERDQMQQSLQQAAQLGVLSDSSLSSSSLPPTSVTLSQQESSLSSPLRSSSEEDPKSQLVRLPLSVLDTLANAGGDTLLFLEKLIGQRDQMEAAVKRLKSLVIEFEPIRDRLQDAYEQMAIQYRIPNKSTKSGSLPDDPQESEDDFDGLELDRFTNLHENLQGYQELFAQVKESTADLSLISRSFSRDLVGLRRGLNQIYRSSTQARLVPFKTLGDPFYDRLERLSQRFHKPVTLTIIGSDVLLDRTLLEELRTPLTHLINNAFDHGVETPEERHLIGKSPTAQITLSAHVEGNQVKIEVRDDGRGIPLQRVYEKAIERGLTQKARSELSEAQILEFLFQPGFSTTSQVSQLSGRGVGLDVVKTEITALGGSVTVQTRLHQGTTFSLILPLGVNLVTVIVVRAQGKAIGFMGEEVLDVIQAVPEAPVIEWKGQSLPLYPLLSFLPLSKPVTQGSPESIIIVSGPNHTPLGILVDHVLDPKPRIIKPLTDLLPLPPYLCGATLMPSGESVPIVLSSRFSFDTLEPKVSVPTVKTTILIAEDSVSSRQLLEEVLTEAGYAVLPCRDGQEALDLLPKHHAEIALVLTDLDMPRMNGLELLQHIRSHSEWKRIPVIFITSRTRAQHRQKAAALGVNGYLGKPYNLEELLTEVQKVVSFPHYKS